MAAKGSKRIHPSTSFALRAVQDVGKSTVAFIPQTFLKAYTNPTISVWAGNGTIKIKFYFKSWSSQEPWFDVLPLIWESIYAYLISNARSN
jgi:hypothetical protein